MGEAYAWLAARPILSNVLGWVATVLLVCAANVSMHTGDSLWRTAAAATVGWSIVRVPVFAYRLWRSRRVATS